MERRAVPDLDMRPPVRLDLWAISLAAGVVAGTVAPALAPMLILAGAIIAVGAALCRDLVPPEWRLMALSGPVFVAAGVAIAVTHAATEDPVAELAALEPGEVALIGTGG